MFQKKRGFILKIDYGLLRVIGLKYDIKSPFDFEIFLFFSFTLYSTPPLVKLIVKLRVGNVIKCRY